MRRLFEAALATHNGETVAPARIVRAQGPTPLCAWA